MLMESEVQMSSISSTTPADCSRLNLSQRTGLVEEEQELRLGSQLDTDRQPE